MRSVQPYLQLGTVVVVDSVAAAVTSAVVAVTSAVVVAELASAEVLISAPDLVRHAETSEQRAIAEVEWVSAFLTLQVESSELRLRPRMSIRL